MGAPLHICALLLSIHVAAFAQWERTGGPYGGVVNTFFVHATGIYAGTDGGGIFRSRDDGRSWAPVGSRAVATSIRKFIADGPLLYAATSSGVIVSDDGGDSWRRTRDSTAPSLDVMSIAFQGTKLFAATFYGLARSTDSGATWTTVTNDTLKSSSLRAIAANDSVIIVGSNRAYRSTDGGATWGTLLAGQFLDVRDIVVEDSVFYIACGQGLARSRDNGRTWSWLIGGNTTAFARGVDGRLYKAGNIQSGLYRSDDDGVTWKHIDSSFTMKAFTAVVVIDSTLLVSPYQLGVYRSVNRGATWSRATEGIMAIHVYQLASNRKAVFAGTEENGLQRSTDFGATWVNVGASFKNARVTSVAAIEDTILAATYADTYLYRSTSNGKSWSETSVATGDYSIGQFFINGGDLYMAANRHVSRSTDNGKSWTRADSGLPDAYVSAFAATRGAVFAGTNTAWTNRDGGIFRSTDRGASWKILTTGLTTYDDVYALIAVDDTIIAGTEKGMYRSTDNGDTWVRTGPSNRTYGAFLKAGAVLYSTLMGVGVNRSTDNGKTWQPFDGGEPTDGAASLCAVGDYLFAAIADGSVVRRRVEGLSGDVASSVQASDQMLVFPNPVDNGTLTVLLPVHRERIVVRLFNELGAEVRATVVRDASDGRAEVDVRGLTAGPYLLQSVINGRRYNAAVIVR